MMPLHFLAQKSLCFRTMQWRNFKLRPPARKSFGPPPP